MFAIPHLLRIKRGLELFNEQKYWECHEELEDLWIEDRVDPARYVYWAVIQVAAMLIHARDGNIVGAQGLMKKAKEKFKVIEEKGIETPLLFEYLDWQSLKNFMKTVDESSSIEDIRRGLDFRFTTYFEKKPWLTYSE